MAAPIVPESTEAFRDALVQSAADTLPEILAESLDADVTQDEKPTDEEAEDVDRILAEVARRNGIPLYDSAEEAAKPWSQRRVSGQMHELLRALFQTAAIERGFMGGIPIPGDGSPPLVIEPRHPLRAALESIGANLEDSATRFGRAIRAGDFAFAASRLPKDRDYEHVTSWWSDRLQRLVLVVRDRETQLRRHVLWPYRFNLDHEERWLKLADTLSASLNYDYDAEVTAMESLEKHVTAHQFKMYLITGMFMESSPRSGIAYLFRRLRPTIALGSSGPRKSLITAEQDGERKVRIIACLCLHPIGYYQGSWAGVMVPTDDVLTHLLLMRGDEHMFWRQANQHSPRNINAGL